MDSDEWKNLIEQMRSLVEQRIILSVDEEEDDRFVVRVSALYGGAYYKETHTRSSPRLNALLEVIGPLEHGHWYNPPPPIPPIEEDISPERLEAMVSNNAIWFESVELLEDGSIIVRLKSEPGMEQESWTFRPGFGHREVIEKHIGPLKPGTVFEFNFE